MPLIASGASGAVSVPKGYLLALMAGAYGTTTFGPGPAARQAPVPIIGQALALGPFPDTQTVYLTSASGQIAYSLQRADGMVASLVPASAFKVSPLILEQAHATGAALTGTLTETVLASILLPGGLLGPNGTLRMRAVASTTNNANTKTLIFRLGGTSIVGTTGASSAAMAAWTTLANRNSLASQVNTNQLANGATSTFSTTTINTAVDQLLTITGTLANIADTMTLESYTIEVLPG